MSDSNANPSPRKRDPDLAGAEAAMHRAAQRARQRAQETTNSAMFKRTADQDEERRAAASGSRPPERRPGPVSREASAGPRASAVAIGTAAAVVGEGPCRDPVRGASPAEIEKDHTRCASRMR